MSAIDVMGLALEEQSRARAIVAGLGPCPIRLSRATTELGSFSVDPRSGDAEIRISRYITDEAQVRETARHELAHQATWQRYAYLGHGALWQTLAVYLDCQPVSCGAHTFDPAVVQQRQRFVVMCKSCGLSITRQRRSKLVRAPWRFACARCAGALQVVVLKPASVSEDG
jgi:predicted SprT family Zn-dependent metalloprotease